MKQRKDAPSSKSRLTSAQEEKLIREIYDNFPESSVCLSCRQWKYKSFDFIFVDDESETHRVGLSDAIRGLRLFIAAMDRGELRDTLA